MKTQQWTTIHDSVGNTMTHLFEKRRMMVVTDRKTGMAYIQKDGENVDKIDCSEKSYDEYVELLLKTAIEDERLSKFSR